MFRFQRLRSSKQIGSRPFRFTRCLLLAFLLFMPCIASGQPKEVDRLAARTATEILRRQRAPDTAPKVLVLSFYLGNGYVSELGETLAGAFVRRLTAEGGITLVAQTEVRRALAEVISSSEPNLNESALIRIAGQVSAEFLILGELTRNLKSVRLMLRVVQVPSGRKIHSATVDLVRTSELDAQYLKFVSVDAEGRPASASSAARVSGKDGVGYPVCLRCPDPEYTDEARRNNHSGTVVLRAVINEAGRISQLEPVQYEPYGLTERAIEYALRWRFRPAQGPDGKPVAVRVKIEVTFKLF